MRTKDKNYINQMKVVFDESENDNVSFNALNPNRELKDWFLLVNEKFEVSDLLINF